MNPLLLTDSYKLTHWKQYPPGTTHVYSYFESRIGARFDKTLFFGLRYFLEKYLAGRFVRQDLINDADAISRLHFGADHFNRAGWQHILDKHDGRLPVLIRAVPEGALVDNNNVLLTIENTDPMVPWLTSYLETLLVQLWYPCTVATQGYYMRQHLINAWKRTSTLPVESLDFKLHDFGFRGVSSVESAGIGGAAHLVNFKGTDNLAGLMMLAEYYGGGVHGFSIPAAEHSTITSWSESGEIDAYANMLTQYPTGTVAVVSDSFDIARACSDIWGGPLRDRVLSRDGVLVVRPDSGPPAETVVMVLDLLSQKFGHVKNSKGFKILHPKVRVIQGDGIDIDTMHGVLDQMEDWGWSVDNIAFGSGGGLLQKLNRDTQRFAFKCSEVTVAGKAFPVYKSPKTDPTKRSKGGRFALYRDPHSGVFSTMPDSIVPAWEPEPIDFLSESFRDGEVFGILNNIDTIRARARAQENLELAP